MNMSQKAESLLYPPLQHHDSFRLLKLKSSACESEWTATLIEARLPRQGYAADAPKYVALSYVCGDATFAVPNEDTIEIRFSVSTALGHVLQDATLAGSLTIWIDQFCINQRNVKEKDQQINMMGRIFAGADEVIGWLGPPYEGSEEAFDDLIIFAGVPPEAPEADKDHYVRFVTARLERLSYSENVLLYIAQVTYFDSDLRNRMKHLFNLSWFKRRWIAQEVCLASKLRVHCGYRSISGEQLFQAINVIQNIIIEGAPAWLNRPFRNAFVLLQTRNKVQEAALGGHCLSFTHIIQTLSHPDCEEDQDRINALLGMIPSNALWFSAECLPAPELFLKFALKHMQHFESAQILHFAGITDPEKCKLVGSWIETGRPAGDLPSWVPDWRISQRQLPMTSAEQDIPNHKTNPPTSQSVFDPARETLSLRGQVLQTPVIPCGTHLDWFNPDEDPQYEHANDPWSNFMFYNYLARLDPLLGWQYRHSPSFAHWFEHTDCAADDLHGIVLRFARTLIMNGMIRSTERPDLTVPPDQILEYFMEYAKLNLVNDTNVAINAFKTMADDHTSMEKVAAYGYLAEHVCRYRTLFIAGDDIVGLGAAGIGFGDKICFFSGLKTPFIVHPKGEDFELRGECYVDGMTDISYDKLDVAESQIVLV